MIDFLSIVHVARMLDTVFQDKNFAANLEYANPYIGLKELYDSGKVKPFKIDPILIRPRISAQVFVNEPDRLAPRGEHDYWSPTWGMLSPHEHHLYVTSKIHTIVQYRAIDFGMEDCHLVFTLPNLGSPVKNHASFTINPSSRFDVFRLKAEQPIDIKKLSYRTKPQVAEKVATVQARLDGEILIHRFPCPWSSLHVFEIACAEGTECLVNVWSSHNTTYGVNIYQHQTI
ncbi:hypothetical protein C8Q76DRAFT_738985 [Earliella scabrosa]|nr:hypothetical protein C8Q76DRAFT_738985 [Earliella scabrosa]